MITAVKIVKAHAAALYWKKRAAKCDYYMRRSLAVLAEAGSGKHETEHGEFVVSENNAYPQALIAQHLTPEQQDMCFEPRWSNARAKVLFPHAYNAAKQENGFKVSI